MDQVSLIRVESKLCRASGPQEVSPVLSAYKMPSKNMNIQKTICFFCGDLCLFYTCDTVYLKHILMLYFT